MLIGNGSGESKNNRRVDSMMLSDGVGLRVLQQFCWTESLTDTVYG